MSPDKMLTLLRNLFHESADYILNWGTQDNLDPAVNEVVEIINNLMSEKANKSALEMLG